MRNHQYTRSRPHVASALLVILTATLVTACGTPSTPIVNSVVNNASNTAKVNGTSRSNTSALSASTGKSGTSASSFPITMTDDTGAKVTVSKRPMHIVSDTEGTDEILVALVQKSRIARLSQYATNPTYSNVVSLAKGIPQIAQDNPETILAAHPDLVLMASYVKPGVVSQVRNSGVPVYEFNNFTSVSSIEKNIGVIGKLVGDEQKAKALVDNLAQNVSKIKQTVANHSKPTVLDFSSYGFAAGSKTTVNEIIQDAGGTNVAAHLNGWQKITDEEIVKMNPDVIIDAKQDQAFLKQLQSNPALQSVNAIKNHRLYAIPDADLTSVSQYIVKGMVDVAHDLHPNLTLPKIQVMK